MQVRRQIAKYSNDIINWYFNGKWHRDGDLPATYCFEKRKLTAIFFVQHGIHHRTTGPAFIDYEYKTKRYYYQNNEYDNLEVMLMMEACS